MADNAPTPTTEGVGSKELLACPFCGGVARMQTTALPVLGCWREWQVECTRCAAQVGYWQDNPATAAQLWNGRHRPPAEDGCSLQSLDMRWLTPALELPPPYQSVLVYGVLDGETKPDTHEGYLRDKAWCSVRMEETGFQGGHHPAITNVTHWAWMPKPHGRIEPQRENEHGKH